METMDAGYAVHTMPVMTSLGIVSGEILTYLERHGATPVRRLVRELEWPAPLVFMAVGSLIRGGLIRAAQHDLEVIVEPDRTWTIPVAMRREEPVPAIWGG